MTLDVASECWMLDRTHGARHGVMSMRMGLAIFPLQLSYLGIGAFSPHCIVLPRVGMERHRPGDEKISAQTWSLCILARKIAAACFNLVEVKCTLQIKTTTEHRATIPYYYTTWKYLVST